MDFCDGFVPASTVFTKYSLVMTVVIRQSRSMRVTERSMVAMFMISCTVLCAP